MNIEAFYLTIIITIAISIMQFTVFMVNYARRES